MFLESVKLSVANDDDTAIDEASIAPDGFGNGLQ